jgi:hypothetical protein
MFMRLLRKTDSLKNPSQIKNFIFCDTISCLLGDDWRPKVLLQDQCDDSTQSRL